jgi:hypothetical protein
MSKAIALVRFHSNKSRKLLFKPIHIPEVNEKSLSGLGSQIPHRSALWSNGGFKHKVEWEWLSQLILRIGGGFHGIFLQHVVQFLCREGVRLALIHHRIKMMRKTP